MVAAESRGAVFQGAHSAPSGSTPSTDRDSETVRFPTLDGTLPSGRGVGVVEPAGVQSADPRMLRCRRGSHRKPFCERGRTSFPGAPPTRAQG